MPRKKENDKEDVKKRNQEITNLNNRRSLRHFTIAQLVEEAVNSGKRLEITRDPNKELVHPNTVFQHPTRDCLKCAVCTLESAYSSLASSLSKMNQLKDLLNNIQNRTENTGFKVPQELDYQRTRGEFDNLDYVISRQEFLSLTNSAKTLTKEFETGYKWLATTLAWEVNEYFYPLFLWRVATNLSVDELQVIKLIVVLNNIPVNKKWEKVKKIREISEDKDQTTREKLQSIFALAKKSDLLAEQTKNQVHEKDLKELLGQSNSASYKNVLEKLVTLLGRSYIGLDELFVAELKTFLDLCDSERTPLLYQIRALALDSHIDLYPELIQEETSRISYQEFGVSFAGRASTFSQDDLVRQEQVKMKTFLKKAEEIVEQKSTETPAERTAAKAEELLKTISKVFHGFHFYMEKVAETT